MVKIINTTGMHSVGLVIDGKIKRIPHSGMISRVITKQDFVKNIDGIPIFANNNGEVRGLPDPQPDTIYIASAFVANWVKRPDVFSPNLQPDQCIYNEYGELLAVKSLLTYW